MLDLSFFLGPLLESTSGHWLSGQEARKNFENDVQFFLEKQKRDTSLDVFFFANRLDIRDEKEYLPLEDIYIPIRLQQKNESLPNREDFMRHFDPKTAKNRKAPKLPDDLNIAQLLSKILGGHEGRQIMLIGNGGAGKSTFMKYLARFFAEKTDRKVRVLAENKDGELKEKQVKINHHYFPIFIRLRDLEQILRQHNNPNWEDNFNLAHFLQAKHGLQFATEQFYPKVLQQLPCLILLDGVDEVPEDKDCGNGLIISRRKIMNWINTQVKVFGAAHPKTSFILTSRPADLSLLARSFQVFELKSFSIREIWVFAEYWYQAYEKILHFCVRTEIHGSRKDNYQLKIELLPENKEKFLQNLDNPHLTELINNPLLLSQAILIHSIDESFELSDVDSLYEKLIDTLLYRWDDVRQMNFYAELFGSSDIHHLSKLIGYIAFIFSKREVTKMTYEELFPEVVKLIGLFKSKLSNPDKIIESANGLLDALRDRGGIFIGGVIAEERDSTKYEFQHKSIQDYLTAYTLATDSSLWQSDGFDLLEVIDRREFWGRTLEFFVNVKNGNPDGFFREYLKKLESETGYKEKLNHFVTYFLLAREKDDALEAEIIKKCEEILMNSPDVKEARIAQICLGKLPLTLNAEHLAFVQKLHHNWLDNFRAVKLAQLYYAKGKGEELLPSLRETSLLNEFELGDGSFYRFRNYCFLGLLQWDYQIWKHILLPENEISDFNHLSRGLALLALWDSLELLRLWDYLDLRDLLDSQHLQDLQDLWDLWDLQDLRDLWKLGDLWNLRKLRDLQDLRDLLQIEQRLEQECQRFIQSPKFLPYLFKLQKISERSLSLEQNRQYFK